MIIPIKHWIMLSSFKKNWKKTKIFTPTLSRLRKQHIPPEHRFVQSFHTKQAKKITSIFLFDQKWFPCQYIFSFKVSNNSFQLVKLLSLLKTWILFLALEIWQAENAKSRIVLISCGFSNWLLSKTTNLISSSNSFIKCFCEKEIT